MSKWIAEFELEDGDTMPEHMDLEYKGTKIDFHCKPLEQKPILDRIRSEIMKLQTYKMFIGEKTVYIERDDVLAIIDKYKGESGE